jgi:predicted O-linked N-acetylglucosamine transferase (SPINDLY family)
MTTIDSELATAHKLLREGAFSEAFVIFNHIIVRQPNELRAWVGVGMYLNMTCQYNEAKLNFEFVIDQQPDNAVAWYGLAQTHNNLGNSVEACQAIDRAADLAPTISDVQLYRAICYASLDATPEQILELFSHWGQAFADPLTARAPPFAPPANSRQQAHKKLKIGYVSADLRDHSVAFFMEPILAHHNPHQVDVYVFSNTKEEDDYTARMKRNVAHWINITNHNDSELYQTIRDLDIDILIDLSGHTYGNRLGLFALRPAPIQITWIGCMYPTGMKAIDYRLTSYSLAPPGTEKLYNEILFRTTTGGVYTPPAGVTVEAEPPCVRNGYSTLVSLNHSRKITDAMLEIWQQILQARPHAQLLILTKELSQEQAEENMLPRLEKLGLPLDRIFISKQLPIEQFMALGEIADIQLDTHPISGGTTTLHALWMGLPVVALPGTDAMSTSTASILTMSRLEEWIAVNENDYIAKALDWIDHPEKIRHFRTSNQTLMQQTAYMDYASSTAEIEKAYRLMWFNHLLGKTVFTDANHDIEQVIQTHFAELTL